MISSILDNDLYKLTMQQAVHMLYPRAEARYVFINRGNTQFPSGVATQLKKEIAEMSKLRLTEAEAAYLRYTCYFLTPVYLDFLKSYQFDPTEVVIHEEKGGLSIRIEGPWYRTILWEVPLMAMISEIYFSIKNEPVQSRDEQKTHNRRKAEALKACHAQFAEFGTRRRYSIANHDRVLRDFCSVDGHTLIGTSNVHMARKHNLRPIGTHAHEWFMFHGAEYGYRQANRSAIDAWTRVYQGYLGIALTDTYTTNAFLNAFDAVEARLFDGVRQDSGDPFDFADKIIAHYKKLRINPMTKTIVFSDALNIEIATTLREYCNGKINVSFGIGTHLTNDIGPNPLNIVIKLSHCRNRHGGPWHPTVKLSDDIGKHSGIPEEIDLCKRTLSLQPQ